MHAPVDDRQALENAVVKLAQQKRLIRVLAENYVREVSDPAPTGRDFDSAVAEVVKKAGGQPSDVTPPSVEAVAQLVDELMREADLSTRRSLSELRTTNLYERARGAAAVALGLRTVAATDLLDDPRAALRGDWTPPEEPGPEPDPDKEELAAIAEEERDDLRLWCENRDIRYEVFDPGSHCRFTLPNGEVVEWWPGSKRGTLIIAGECRSARSEGELRNHLQGRLDAAAAKAGKVESNGP